METPQNEIVIDVRLNPKLREFLSKIADGDEGEFEELRFRRKSMTEETFRGVILGISLQGYQPPPGEPAELEPAPGEGVAINISGPPPVEKGMAAIPVEP